MTIGKMSYINSAPQYYIIENELKNNSNDRLKLYSENGTPAMLNRFLANGDIDIAPCSSVEFLKNQSNYTYIKYSISARKEVKSVLLLSDEPIELIKDKPIFITNQTATSMNLLKVILAIFEKTNFEDIKYTDDLNIARSKLIIGDDAMLEYYNKKYKYIYDLAKVWYENTNTYFTFGLWTYRKNDKEKYTENLLELENLLEKASKLAVDKSYHEELYKYYDYKTKTPFSLEELSDYWGNCLIYKMSDAELNGFKLFENYLRQLKIII